MMRLYSQYSPLPLFTWAPLHVAGIALILYTDPACKNQVGFLSGSYNGVCQSTLGTAAVSFKVVDPQSGCLVTLYPAAKPACPATPNNFGFAQIDRCYDNSNGTIAAYSVDLCDAPAPLPIDKTTPAPAPLPSSSPLDQTPPPGASSSEKTTPTLPSTSNPPDQTPSSVSIFSIEQTTSTPISATSHVPQTSARASPSETTTLTQPSSSSLPSEAPPSAQSSPPAPAPSPEGLTRAETIIIGALVPIGVAIPSIVFAWLKFCRGRGKKSGALESNPNEGYEIPDRAVA